jgi:hypothetical protein
VAGEEGKEKKRKREEGKEKKGEKKKKKTKKVDEGDDPQWSAEVELDDEEQNDLMEEERQNELEDIEAELRAEEEQAQQTLENNIDEAFQGTTTSFEDDEQVRAETDVEEDETRTFETWSVTCREAERHFYLTNINIGHCTCPDHTTVGYICKHLFRGLQMCGKTMRDLPSTVTNAPHLCNDVDVCKATDVDMMYDSDLVRVNHKSAVEDSAESPPEASPTSSRPSSPPLPPSPPLPSTSPSLGEPTPERNLNLDKDILRSKWLQDVKILNTWAHQEMPDEVYGQCQELVNESVNQIRALLDEAMVPGDFTIFGRAKGSNSRVSHSITKNKTLRGTKTVAGKGEAEFVEKRGKGRPRENKPKLPRWETLETLGETTSLP